MSNQKYRIKIRSKFENKFTAGLAFPTHTTINRVCILCKKPKTKETSFLRKSKSKQKSDHHWTIKKKTQLLINSYRIKKEHNRIE